MELKKDAPKAEMKDAKEVGYEKPTVETVSGAELEEVLLTVNAATGVINP